MKMRITEYLAIDLTTEMWECRRCGKELISAHENYKRGLLVHDRDPDDIHKPLINPDLYDYSFAADPSFTALLEFCCPNCGVLVETEYTVPGHPPVHDIELDIESLKKKAEEWGEYPDDMEIPENERLQIRHHHH